MFDGMLELEKQSPGSAGAFMPFLSSGGRAARIYCEYNAPLYNQRENSKSLVIIAPVGLRNETKRKEGRSCTLWPAGAGATELTKGYTKTHTNEHTNMHIIIKMPKIRNKEKNLKAEREKNTLKTEQEL